MLALPGCEEQNGERTWLVAAGTSRKLLCMDQQRERRIGAGTLILSALFLGRETISWLWSKVLEAVSGLFSGESPKLTVPSPFPG